MLSITYTVFLLLAATISNPFPDTQASRIDAMNIPLVVRNSTGPIDLSCVYYVGSEENGLVIKWYHNMDQIYQWIPPMPPQDAGVINGFVEYPEQDPNSRSVIRLKTITLEMSGEYSCTISTFQESDTMRSRMIVYVPETDATIHVSSFNETHLNLTCVASGAHPRPILKLYIEGIEIDDYYDGNEEIELYRKDMSVKRTAFVSNIFEPIVLDCEISIPHTDYKRRERIVYYPVRSLSQISTATTRHITSLSIRAIIIISCTLILLLAY
ncbi:uncharacterized protein LOC128877064 isoform X1 [Hylaeus volcanicus]|uniref:uncharacterized protein LOC128877064 isoform X1 n=2 Tax=Hylaeus volcanicus TaxID=313075 RepID=UPI0023B823EB|nr:uncharacterized protein LOC128877064 isoform X1 [Hylaeus volcanicus]